MGTFSVSIQVGNPAGRQFVEVEALVDTGASDTVVPQELLRRLGIIPIDRFAYSIADETVVEYDVGEARLRRWPGTYYASGIRPRGRNAAARGHYVTDFPPWSRYTV